MARDDFEEAAAATATLADARAFMAGEYDEPMPGTLAAEIDSYARGAQAVAMTLTAAIVALCFLIATAVWPSSAQAQALDGAKPQAISAPIAGLYVDPIAPQRYCIAAQGQFGMYGPQHFLHCAQGFTNAGHTFTSVILLGVEYQLFRLQADGGLLTPVVVTSVTVTESTHYHIRVRFGSPGAQSPTYTLVRQGHGG